MQSVRSILFLLIMIVSGILWSLVLTACFLLPYRWRWGIGRSWAGFMLFNLKTLCGLGYSVADSGNIPRQPVVILSKHQSAWETLGLQRIFPPFVWVLKRELLWVPFFGWALAAQEPIAIDRKSGRRAVKQVIEQGKRQLANGRSVVVFPEGTRVAPGVKRRYGMGGAMLAIEAGVPIVPVAHNAGVFWRRRGVIKYPGCVQVIIGPLIETRNRDAAEVIAEVESWIETQVDRLEQPGGLPSSDVNGG